ncbi:MAG TPA: hypothetical protein VE912_24935 [Bacteroidales bacterium]|nr:hypothetical protein [Bacteroidales bacterium]
MKKILLLLAVFLLPFLNSCESSHKATSERRSLMMPRQSEMPRNQKKFKEVKHRHRSKYRKQQKRRAKKKGGKNLFR